MTLSISRICNLTLYCIINCHEMERGKVLPKETDMVVKRAGRITITSGTLTRLLLELFTRRSKQKYAGQEGEDDGQGPAPVPRTLRVNLVGGLPFYIRIKPYMDNDLSVLDRVPDIEDIFPPKR